MTKISNHLFIWDLAGDFDFDDLTGHFVSRQKQERKIRHQQIGGGQTRRQRVSVDACLILFPSQASSRSLVHLCIV